MGKVLAAIYLFYSALIFIALMFLVFPLILLFSALLNADNGKNAVLFFLRFWSWCFSIATFVLVKTTHKNTVNLTVAHIYVGNHGSYLDAIASCISIPQFFSPLGKIEMTKIPVFGLIYKRIVVLIERNNKESRELAVLSLKKDIANGQSILIFPEGTMNTSKQLLNPFYDGAFRIAIETQTPILPFVIINNRKLLPRKNPLKARPGILNVVFLPAINVNNFTLDDLPQLKQTVFNLMEKAITKHS